MKTLFAAGALALALAASQPAAAVPYPSGGLTRQDVADWLHQQGLDAKIHNDDTGESIVSSTISDVNFDIYLYDCKAERCTTIQYAAGWTPFSEGTLRKANDWNAKKLYVKAYLDDKNNVWGEYDVIADPGGSWELLDATLGMWRMQIAEFKTFFGQ